MLYDLLSLPNYFLTFNGLLGIETVIYGTADDVLNRQNHNIRYPALWIELLEEHTDLDGHDYFDLRITIQHHAGNNPRDEDRIVLNSLRKILKKVIEKMRADSPLLLVFPLQIMRFYYKEGGFGGDKELLAQTELKIGTINHCNDFID